MRTRVFEVQDLHDADFPNMNLTIATEHVGDGKYSAVKRCIFQWWNENGEPEDTVWAIEYEDTSTSPWLARDFGWNGDTVVATQVRKTNGRWEPLAE